MNIKFKLNNGREVWIDEIQLSRTYAGVLAMDSIAGINELIIKSHFQYPSNWGKRKFLKLLPNSEEMKIPFRTTIYVWLDSEPIEPSNYGSELVCGWLDNFDDSTSLKDFISKKLQNLDWEKEAMDYDSL